MITQSVMDFLRDIVVNWISGIGTIFAGIDMTAAGAAVGGAAAQASHFIALFIAPAVWPAVVAAWGVFMAITLTTAAIAIFTRRGKAD